LRSAFLGAAFFLPAALRADFFLAFAMRSSVVCDRVYLLWLSAMTANGAAPRSDLRDCGRANPHPNARRLPT
jgi:hypothetical protein